MDSSPEVPLLNNSGNRLFESRIVNLCMFIGSVGSVIGFVGVIVLCMVDDGKHFHLMQPELQLNSLLVCPTNRDSVIWDLKFDLINTENDSSFCLDSGFGFDVSVFLYNQSKLVTKAFAAPKSTRECIDPGNRTSLIALVEDDSTSIQDLINDFFSGDDDDNDNQPINGTIRVDLKLHNDDYDRECGDAKVELSSLASSSSSSSCGSMVGDPFACSYEPPPHCTTSCRLWVCASPIVALIGTFVLSFILIVLLFFLAIKCPCRC